MDAVERTEQGRVLIGERGLQRGARLSARASGPARVDGHELQPRRRD